LEPSKSSRTSLKEKWAVKYRVKYGKEPPEPTDQKEEPKKK
jgi:hypothetical protein